MKGRNTRVNSERAEVSKDNEYHTKIQKRAKYSSRKDMNKNGQIQDKIVKLGK